MADKRTALVFLPLFLLFVIPGASSETCAPIDRDIKVLRDQPFWQFEVPNVKGCNPFHPPSNVSSTCLFYFSICHPVPSLCPQDSGICLTNKIKYGPSSNNQTLYTLPKNIGSYEPVTQFNTEWNSFKLTFGPGEVSGLFVPIITIITFNCKRNATWKQSPDGKVPHVPKINYTFVDDVLTEYKLAFDYNGACPGGGGGGGGGGGDEEPPHPLSVGSILLILFIPGMFLYCVVGALINRGAGKTGKEMIPNSKFWSNLPGLISDGFSFAVAKITCSDMSTSRETYNRM